MKLLWKSNHSSGFLKSPAKKGDAGLDMTLVNDAVINPHSMAKLDCGINIALPDGVVAVPIVRSSFANSGIMVITTLIDTGYRGPLFLFAFNATDKYVTVPSGTRVGQLLLLTNLAEKITLERVDELPVSERGESGFGSTGGFSMVKGD